MNNFNIDFKKIVAPIANQKKISGELELFPGAVTLLTGENGVGKSSFIQALKIYQADLFPGKKLNFIDQKRLEPLNEISFDQMIKELHGFKHQSHQFFYDYIGKVSDFKKKPISLLSGGQNQIVKILVSAYLGGDIYFFDEAFGHLDAENTELLKDYIKYLKLNQFPILIIEHHHEHLKSEINHIYNLNATQDHLIISRVNGN